jgi:hypothetical protein
MSLRLSGLIGAAIAALGAAAQAQTPEGPRLLLDSRLRYEFIDQDGLPEDAHAATLRNRFGLETPAYAGFRLLLELEHVAAVLEDYNDGVDGDPRRPVVSDPESFEFNRVQLSWSGAGGRSAVLGRQAIDVGSRRFLATSTWRQLEQTFDAVRLGASVGPAKLHYAYVDRVLRATVRRSPQRAWESDSHVLWAEAKTPWGALTPYAVVLDLDEDAPLQSSATWGARLSGSRKAAAGELLYAVEYARQTDHAGNPRAFGLDYIAVEAGVRRGAASVTANLERLGGDGRTGLRTPLGSRHSFQGWSDAITDAPAGGLLDLNIKAVTTWKGAPVGDGLRFEGRAYRFTDEAGDRELGEEFNASVGTRLNRRVSAELKAALFNGRVPAYADRTKVWVTTEVKF